ncbi:MULTISPECIES: hypothetical protein [unclassified Modestobacter]|uniref:hypothetical protein n=1 Tax=unclassified Modestobacter TaxID=2643866 RepID=UPI0022AA7878|nr:MULTISPECIES: hypothetical protein [unclassified Modestobacter]MCZ2813408.1 hypothetical protein [Modestobacter sp. VKM Ac-2979]MCZ2842400.1 hypothetical protein [Modestobacter sp. VKM Ac-2980]MCZ2846568.1 hypothetical protein [Modestobacter sp. VKM Ac-2978]
MSAAEDHAPIRLLWTGGWDSSFRLMQALLVEHRPVQPIYVVNPERRSTLLELSTMARMREQLLQRLDDPAMLAPVEMHLRWDFPPSEELQALNASILRNGTWIGSQYVYLAGVAERLGWSGVEVCMQAHDDGPTALHRLVFTDDRGTLSSAPEAQMFRFWSFPVLRTTKGEMAQIAREHGFLDLLSQRWFCHDPLGDLPCGQCRPCQLTNRDGVTFAPPALVLGRKLVRTQRRVTRAARRRVRRTA